jgi:hypothetical protein
MIGSTDFFYIYRSDLRDNKGEEVTTPLSPTLLQLDK